MRRPRYLPPRLYIQIGDYSGGLRYLNWFDKNFPDDIGLPDFLFEWTLILFKTGRLKEAERKAFQTFTSNTYLFDKFFGKRIIPLDKWEGSNLEVADFALNCFDYSNSQSHLSDFARWLDNLLKNEKFRDVCDKYIEIRKRLNQENDRETRIGLIQQAAHLEDEL